MSRASAARLPIRSAPIAKVFGAPGSDPREREWPHFCCHLSLAWIHLRRHWPGIRALERGPLALLRAFADHWQGHAEAYPGQEWLGELIGYDVRSVRDFTDALVDAELLHVRRERQTDGYERIYYARLGASRRCTRLLPPVPRRLRGVAARRAATGGPRRASDTRFRTRRLCGA
jgi:hypothetical protein